jgi:hypothetical protein
VVGRLVEQQGARATHQQRGQGQPRALAAGERPQGAIRRDPFEPKSGEHDGGPAAFGVSDLAGLRRLQGLSVSLQKPGVLRPEPRLLRKIPHNLRSISLAPERASSITPPTRASSGKGNSWRRNPTSPGRTTSPESGSSAPARSLRSVDLQGPRGLPALAGAVRWAERERGVNLLHVQHAGGTYGFRRAVFFLPPLLRAAGVRLPLVTTAHEYAWWEWEPRFVPKDALEATKTWGQRRSLRDREDGFLLTGSHAIVATNAPIADAIAGCLPSSRSRLHRIPLAANVDAAPVKRGVARKLLRARFGWPSDSEVVTFFGFLHPVKGSRHSWKRS